MFYKNVFVDHPFGATLKYMAIGIEANAPTIAPLLVVFFQNNPNKKWLKYQVKQHLYTLV